MLGVSLVARSQPVGMLPVVIAGVVLGLAVGAAQADSARTNPDGLKAQYQRPTVIHFPKDNPYSRTKAALGKMLFFDPRVSKAQNMNCVSCHNPSFGWEAPLPKAIGAQNMELKRHAPAVVNLAWVTRLFWDGRSKSLEEQAAGPITAHDEMNMPMDELVKRLDAIEGYRFWFDRAFPEDGLNERNILRAIATFERTLVSSPSSFDRWIGGNEVAISPAAKRGFGLFNGKAACAGCHSGWNFTDNKFHDIGLDTTDVGRAAIDSSSPQTLHAFKTPSLRNLTRRSPFMHDGLLPDIDSVIEHYLSGGIERPSRSDKMVRFTLTQSEREDLVAFLRTLDSGSEAVALPILPY